MTKLTELDQTKIKMTGTATLYYICRSEDVHTGLFGSAEECADWYLTYCGAECRIYPKCKNELADRDAHSDEGDGPVWYVAFKPANDYLFREAPFTVVGNDQKDAYHALWRHVIENSLLNAEDGDDEFYMVRAEQALPGVMRRAEMRELYDLAGEPATGKEDDALKWFCNADHPREALLKMVDILSNRPWLPLTGVNAAQIKRQIAYSVGDEGKLLRHKTVCHPSPLVY